MATEVRTQAQSMAEIRTWPVSFAPDLPAGVEIIGCSAVHVPPSEAPSSTLVTFDADLKMVYATLGPLVITGDHILRVFADCSDGEKLEVKLIIPVSW